MKGVTVKKFRTGVLLIVLAASAGVAEAARVRVVHTRPRARVTVTVRPGFPLRRTMPNVVVRTATFRVAPRVYLAPVAFGAVVVAALPPASARGWTGVESLDREDGWTDFTMNVDKRGT